MCALVNLVGHLTYSMGEVSYYVDSEFILERISLLAMFSSFSLMPQISRNSLIIMPDIYLPIPRNFLMMLNKILSISEGLLNFTNTRGIEVQRSFDYTKETNTLYCNSGLSLVVLHAIRNANFFTLSRLVCLISWVDLESQIPKYLYLLTIGYPQ